jgi:hypothetical protein
VRSNILEKHPSSDVRVYVVWFDMLPGDNRALVDRRVLDDGRVTNLYDPGRVAGAWFSEHVNGGGGIVWDAYFLYGRDAAWTDTPQPLLSSGGPVIGSSADLAAAFGRLS